MPYMDGESNALSLLAFIVMEINGRVKFLCGLSSRKVGFKYSILASLIAFKLKGDGIKIE
jgi:hypothetical protein